jgi:hypothetical protein
MSTTKHQSVAVEIAGVTPEQLTALSVLHRRLVGDEETPSSITTTDSNGDLFVTNDGASGNFRVRTMRLRPDQVVELLEFLG